METQVALAVPGEDGSLTVYNSTQSPDFLQQAIGACLNIPLNKIQVICRRLGGSFGGKVLRNQHVNILHNSPLIDHLYNVLCASLRFYFEVL